MKASVPNPTLGPTMALPLNPTRFDLRFLSASSSSSSPRTRTQLKATASDERIVPVELHKEATDAYMAYAILYAMHELRLSSPKPFVKCARLVGDTALYDSLVPMAQVAIRFRIWGF